MKYVKSVDEYISSAPQGIKPKLREFRATIKSVVPDALERISYGMPSYGNKGTLPSFAYFRDHFSLFVTPGILDKFKDEVKDLRTGKATLRFPLDKKLPSTLIKKLVKAQAKNNDMKEKKKGS